VNGKTAKRHTWTADKLATLRNLYPHYTAEVVARVVGCSVSSVWARANREGIGKSAAFLASQQSGRIARGKQLPSMVANQFKPGQPAWNKGRPFDSGGRSHTTRFKPGRLPTQARNYVPIGTLRICCDGYLERKVNDTEPVPTRRWKAVHRLVWEAAHGPIPAGHIVVFKPGNKTVVEAEITADKLDCITKAENLRRNHPRNKSPELGRLVQLKGQITRQVNRIAREHKEQQGQTA
jgi:HNH endonuclease